MERRASLGDPAWDDQNLFLARLQLLTGLADGDLAKIGSLCTERRPLRERSDLYRQGERPARLHILLDGWACRVRHLADGRRQITTLLVPGDLCDLDGLHLRRSDYAVSALTRCTVAAIDHAALTSVLRANPGIAAAFGWLGAVENAMLAERTSCLGRRTARGHLAHFICELFLRLSVVGRTVATRFPLPLTQEEIADTLGLTAVHVNRVLNALRVEGLIEQHGRALVIPKWGALAAAAEFSPDYLHLEGVGGRGDAAASWIPMPAHSANGRTLIGV